MLPIYYSHLPTYCVPLSILLAAASLFSCSSKELAGRWSSEGGQFIPTHLDGV